MGRDNTKRNKEKAPTKECWQTTGNNQHRVHDLRALKTYSNKGRKSKEEQLENCEDTHLDQLRFGDRDLAL
jgi:hypothetical protein